MDKKVIYYTQETLRQTANLLASGSVLHAAATVKNAFVSLPDTDTFFEELSKFATTDELDDLKDLVKTLFGG